MKNQNRIGKLIAKIIVILSTPFILILAFSCVSLIFDTLTDSSFSVFKKIISILVYIFLGFMPAFGIFFLGKYAFGKTNNSKIAPPKPVVQKHSTQKPNTNTAVTAQPKTEIRNIVCYRCGGVSPSTQVNCLFCGVALDR